MTSAQLIFLIIAFLLAFVAAGAVQQVRRRNLQVWLGGYLRHQLRRRLARKPATPRIHVLLCIADHFEPDWGGASEETARARVDAWVRTYPRLFGPFRDSDGRPPRRTFFYPIEQYAPRHLDELATLCRAGFGEVEVHLHHDRDTPENLTSMLRHATQQLADRHGLLGRWPDGRIAYGFVHGNWALCNSRPGGRWCGVNNELKILRETGCYADFTLPSAPDATQTRKINSIYYATGDPHRPKAHDRGIDVGLAPAPPESLMLIQGPLLLWRPRGRWAPRIENGCLQRSQPPTMERLDHWIQAGIGVPSRPDWVFIKLHTHGAPEVNQRMLLGDPMIRFHEALARRAAADDRFCFHYVTAREMYNLAKAAEAGWTGSVAAAREFLIAPARPDNATPKVLSAESSASTS
jgi:hypothetical protein